MILYKITPNKRCNKTDLRIFYMHANGYVDRGYKNRPSTTVPLSRLGRVLDALAKVDRSKFRFVYGR